MLDSDEIIAFVKKNQKKERTRWIDIENEFCINRKWSKGKFVNNWKDAKTYLEKRPTKNWSRGMYFVKEPWDKEATKYVLTEELKDQELNTVIIPNDEMEKALIKLAERYRSQSINRSSFFKANKLWRSYKHLFLNFHEEDLRRESKYWNVFIQHPSGVSTPDLSIEDKFAILKVLSRLAATRSPIEDIEKRGFTVILSYNPSLEEESEEERQEILKRKIAAWKKDKGIKKMTKEHLEKMREDELKMKKLYVEGIRKWYESLV